MHSERASRLLVVLGAGSSIASQVVPSLGSFDLYLLLSSRPGSIQILGENHDFVVVEQDSSQDFEAKFRGITSDPKILLKEVCVVSFSGITDSTVFKNQDSGEIGKIIQVNLTSIVYLVHAALNCFAIGKLRFVFLSSSRAILGDRGTVMYSTTKHALNGFVKALSLEYGRFGLRANVLSLGISEVGLATLVSDADSNRIVRRSANGRPIQTESITRSVEFLFTNLDLNGTVLMCDGGYH